MKKTRFKTKVLSLFLVLTMTMQAFSPLKALGAMNEASVSEPSETHLVATSASHTFNSVAIIAELGLVGAPDTNVGTWSDGFFTVTGGRWRPGQGGGVFETNRNGDGEIQFTTDGSSNVVIVASSTGGTNISAITIWNEAGVAMTELNGVTTVLGTNPQTTLTFENLPAGTYRIVSNDIQEGNSHNRGVRIFSVAVQPTAIANTFSSVATIAQLGLTGGVDTPVTTPWSDGFFTVTGGQWRPSQGGGVYETARNGVGAIEFTTDGTATVVIVASSNGGSNTSAITIWNADGEPLTERDGIQTVFGTNPQTTLTFENLPAGTYRIVSNDIQEGGSHNRGVRIFSVVVTQADSNPMNPADYPTDLEAVGGYDSLVRLTWTPVANAIHHEFRYRPVGTDAWSVWAETELRNSHSVTPLTNGTTYEFQVRGHDGIVASAESAIVTATPTALPVLEIANITPGTTHDFGTVPHNYTAANITPFEVVIHNTGTAPAEDVAVTLTSGHTSFALQGEITGGSLAPNAEMTFQVAPTLILAAGLHTGVVTISANNLPDINFNVNFNVLSQNMNAEWGPVAYHFNFANLPTDGTQTGAGAIGSIPTRPISERHPSIRTVASHARQQDFELLIGIGTNANNGFRSNGTAPNNFIDPNGAGRLLGASHSLTAPIRVELDVLAVAPTLRSQLTLYFGDQSVTFPVTGTPANPGRVVVEFASGEGVLRTSAFPWGANNAADPIGRVGLQAVRIFEGEFTGPWIEANAQDIAFRNLPYGFTQSDLETQYLEITNVGSDPSPITAEVGSNFEITQAPATTLQAGESTIIGVRPITGLASGAHESSLVVTATADGNRLIIPVAVTVNEPLALPNDVVLFYSGDATSTTTQFPNNPNENVDWSHDFRRISFTAGSHLIRFNGEVRDADVSLAIPFILNDVLWVPLASAQAALPNTAWSITDGYLTVTSATATYNGVALIATEAIHGGNATFVALQEISEALNIGNIGWDERSQTLVVVTGATVEQGNVLYNNINNRPEAWYGSPNSIAIATNFVYMQRANGGWPRGIGQINALPHQPDIGGMDPDIVQQQALGFNNEDSYFGRGITTNETRFLLRMYEATGIQRFLESGLRGFDTIIRTQDPIGGWPYQISGGSYHRALSISDNAISNLLWLMMDIETDNLFADTLGEARVAQAVQSLELGMGWILNTQVRSAGFADGVERLTAWPMAVYQSGVENFNLVPGATAGVTGQPAWQREFEPMSINGNESVDIIRFLMSIPNPSEEIREAIHAGAYFFNYIRIDGYRLNHATGLDPLLGRNIVPEEGARPLWPRFIDLENFEPLFYDRTGPFATTVSPHQMVSIADFEAAHGQWQGYRSGFISANATSSGTDASAVRAGTLRNLYRDENGVLSTDRSGTFDLPASFHNLSFERRSGFNYINHFAETLQQEYAEWLEREGGECEVIVDGQLPGTNGSQWRICEDGTLEIDSGFVNWTGALSPWNAHRALITQIEIGGPITAGASLRALFRELSGVTAIEGLTYFDTTATTTMYRMFFGLNGVTELDVTSFDTRNVTSMALMFRDASSLVDLDVSGFETGNVTDMREMFRATQLTQLDLSNFDTGNVTTMNHMFTALHTLRELTLGESFSFIGTPNLVPIRQTEEFTGLWQGAGGAFTSAQLMAQFDGSTMAGTFVWQEWTAPEPDICEVVARGRFANGAAVAGAEWRLCDDGTLEVDSGFINWTLVTSPWHAHRADITEIVFTGPITGGTSLRSLFHDLFNLEEIDGLTYLDTRNVTNMGRMFRGASSLTEIDLSNFDTRNVTDMGWMFFGASGLESLDVTGFDTRNVVDMGLMFREVSNLESLDVTGFETGNVTDMREMFRGMSSLEALDLSSFDTSSVTNMNHMFVGLTSLRELILGNLFTPIGSPGIPRLN